MNANTGLKPAWYQCLSVKTARWLDVWGFLAISLAFSWPFPAAAEMSQFGRGSLPFFEAGSGILDIVIVPLRATNGRGVEFQNVSIGIPVLEQGLKLYGKGTATNNHIVEPVQKSEKELYIGRGLPFSGKGQGVRYTQDFVVGNSHNRVRGEHPYSLESGGRKHVIRRHTSEQIMRVSSSDSQFDVHGRCRAGIFKVHEKSDGSAGANERLPDPNFIWGVNSFESQILNGQIGAKLHPGIKPSYLQSSLSDLQSIPCGAGCLPSVVKSDAEHHEANNRESESDESIKGHVLGADSHSFLNSEVARRNLDRLIWIIVLGSLAGIVVKHGFKVAQDRDNAGYLVFYYIIAFSIVTFGALILRQNW